MTYKTKRFFPPYVRVREHIFCRKCSKYLENIAISYSNLWSTHYSTIVTSKCRHVYQIVIVTGQGEYSARTRTQPLIYCRNDWSYGEILDRQDRKRYARKCQAQEKPDPHCCPEKRPCTPLRVTIQFATK